MTTDPSNINFKLASDFINYTNRCVFLTGKAGTGKTTFLKFVKENSHKQIAVVAPTGVAAINAGGVTIHSFFQLPFAAYTPGKLGFDNQNERIIDKHNLLKKVRLNKQRIEIIQQLELLIIDEISMVRCDVLDAIDVVLKHYRNNHYKPFGGLQVLFIGDMFQLPPVVQQDEWKFLQEHYQSPYFFSSQVIKTCEPACVELTKIYRQDDEVFINLLNKIRHNNLDEDAMDILNDLYKPTFEATKEDGYITLSTHNAHADAINKEALSGLNNESFFFKATIEGDFGEKMYPTDEVLELKLGSQVMFTKNDLDKSKRYFNGKIGTISKINNETIEVVCKDDNATITVDTYKWENIKYTINNEKQLVEEQAIGSFKQYPLRLAWAITIHKSQGLTFKKAIIDAGKSFAAGQVYVALSRCISLDGIVLVSKINSNNLFSDNFITDFTNGYKNSQLESSVVFEKHLHQIEVMSNIFICKPMVEHSKKMLQIITTNPTHFSNNDLAFCQQIVDASNHLWAVGNKFLQQINELDKDATMPEDNEPLQQRIGKAATYYLEKIGNLIVQIETNTIVTESRLLAKEFNDCANSFYMNCNQQIHQYKIMEQGFFYDQHIQHKQQFIASTFSVNVYASKTKSSSSYNNHPQLYDSLTELRNSICEEENLPIYILASSNSLKEMVDYLPQNKEELKRISGFGNVKAEKYGKQFLDIIVAYCQHNNLQSLIHTRNDKNVKEQKVAIKKTDTKLESYTLFVEGKTILEIAKERNLTIQTIESHLTKYIANGSLQITQFMTLAKAETIEKVCIEMNDQNLDSPIKEKLGNDYSFSEIKMVKSWIESKANSSITQ
jgi:PIF1-like helicase/Helix-turn-helix domain/HRDC domain